MVAIRPWAVDRRSNRPRAGSDLPPPSPHCNLLVRTGDGELVGLGSGEVSLRLS